MVNIDLLLSCVDWNAWKS